MTRLISNHPIRPILDEPRNTRIPAISRPANAKLDGHNGRRVRIRELLPVLEVHLLRHLEVVGTQCGACVRQDGEYASGDVVALVRQYKDQ